MEVDRKNGKDRKRETETETKRTRDNKPKVINILTMGKLLKLG